MRILPTIMLAMMLCGLLPVYAAKNDNLAQVAIVGYDNRTDSKNFNYLPASLAEAINGSMQKRFEYARVDEAAVQKVADQVLAANRTLGDAEAAEIARKAKADILIYGFLVFDNATKQIVVETRILFIGQPDKTVTLTPARNKVDNSLFKMADNVADAIVNEITKHAMERSQNQKARPQNEKIKLEKDETIPWRERKLEAQLSLGPFVPLGTIKESVKTNFGFRGSVRYRFWRFVHAEFDAGYNKLTSKQDTSATGIESLGVVDAQILVGASWFATENLRLSGAAGAGWYMGTLRSTADSLGFDEKRSVNNPAVSFYGAAHYMLPWFSKRFFVGLRTGMTFLFDKSQDPLYGFSTHLAVGMVF